MKIEYVECGLKTIMQYFARDFETKGKIISFESFVDTSKERVIFKLYIGEPDDFSASPEESLEPKGQPHE